MARNPSFRGKEKQMENILCNKMDNNKYTNKYIPKNWRSVKNVMFEKFWQ